MMIPKIIQYKDRGKHNRESKIVWKQYTIFRRFKKAQRLLSTKSYVKSI